MAGVVREDLKLSPKSVIFRARERANVLLCFLLPTNNFHFHRTLYTRTVLVSENI